MGRAQAVLVSQGQILHAGIVPPPAPPTPPGFRAGPIVLAPCENSGQEDEDRGSPLPLSLPPDPDPDPAPEAYKQESPTGKQQWTFSQADGTIRMLSMPTVCASVYGYSKVT